MLKVYEVPCNSAGQAFIRITKALRQYAPEGVEFVSNPDSADLVIVHTIGAGEVPDIERHLSKALIMQYCFLTTPWKELDWSQYWSQAKGVVSYYDLPQYTDREFNFIHTPLGVDSDLEYMPAYKFNTCFTTGHIAETEKIDCAYNACRQINGTLVHTGENFGDTLGWSEEWYRFRDYLPDSDYRKMVASCKFVTGLREVEGFEMAAIEGAVLGTFPIVPDLPMYRLWYDEEWCEFIDMAGDVTQQLVKIFNSDRKITKNLSTLVKNKFSWYSIVNNIFSPFM
jgi:hypothetical protein